jgi:uncharacterized protein (DUF1778 family)
MNEKQTQMLKVRITPLQKQLMINKAQLSGFKNLSDYARHKIFEPETSRLVKEIHQKLIK